MGTRSRGQGHMPRVTKRETVQGAFYSLWSVNHRVFEELPTDLPRSRKRRQGEGLAGRTQDSTLAAAQAAASFNVLHTSGFDRDSF